MLCSSMVTVNYVSDLRDFGDKSELTVPYRIDQCVEK